MDNAPGFEASGWDRTQVVCFSICTLLFGGIGAPLLAGVALGSPRLAAGIAAALILITASGVPLKYRLRIGVEGMDCAGVSLLGTVTGSAHFPLDADLDCYWSFESDEPEGICIRPSWLGKDNGEEESDCFGPSGLDATKAFLQTARAALDDARRTAEVFVPDLRCRALERQLEAIALDRAERSQQGRIIGAETIAPLRIGAIELAPGAKLRFNRSAYAEYIASSRPDQLTEATCAGPSKLSRGLFACAGTKLAFHASQLLARVEAAAPGRLELDGFVLDAAPRLEFDEADNLMAGVLAEPLWVRSIAIPAGSPVQARGFRCLDLSLTLREMKDPRKGGWRITLAAKISLPDLELQPGDQLLVDRKLSKLIGVISARKIVVDGRETYPRFLPLPLRSDGAIDRGRRLTSFLKLNQKR